MTTGRRIAATRMNLIRERRRLERLNRGASLLRKKREALVSELFRLARPAADIRTRITEQVLHAYPALSRALAVHGHLGLRPLGWPPRDLHVEIRPALVWGIPVSEITEAPAIRRSLRGRSLAPGSAGPVAIETGRRFEALAELLVEAAPREARIRRLGEAVARTSRQVHSLERRVAPELSRAIARVERTLDEREREEHLRLKHVQARRASPAAGPRSPRDILRPGGGHSESRSS